jgi:hypothetical protein
MNVGDAVVDIRSVGTIVGVAKSGNPVVQWPMSNGDSFEETLPEDLITVTLPTPVEELDPSKDAE